MATHPLTALTALAPGLPSVAAARAATPAHAWGSDDDDSGPKRKLRFRTVWISDTHLGTSGCNADLLLDFLKAIQPETLYLVGDIIDGWRLKRGWYWPPRHNDIIRRVLKLANKGTRVVYVPGQPRRGGRATIPASASAGSRWCRRRSTSLPTAAACWCSTATSSTASSSTPSGSPSSATMPMPRCSSSTSASTASAAASACRTGRCRRTIKKKVKNAVSFISRFEEAVAHAARDRGVDGVVCGHIHSAEIRDFAGVTYYNDGDWVESCTALVEHGNGRMEIVDWAKRVAARGVAAEPELELV